MTRTLALAVVLFALPAHAHDPAGHALHHHWYMGLKQPGTGMSCCSDKDCAPARWRSTPNGIEFLIGGQWIMPPKSTVMEIETIDGDGHWCGIKGPVPHTFCAIVPRGGV
jgi:hypothetical protein